jgi:hypothetical protein
MAGSQIIIVALQIESQRLGYQAISLQAYDTVLESAIMAGSVVEIGSALFEFTADEPITGWGGIANNNPVYIKLTVAGASVTASFTTVAPTWSTSKQGWYIGAERVIGGLYKDGAGLYTKKWLYGGQNFRAATANLRDVAVTVDKLADDAVIADKIDKGFDAGGSVAVPAGDYWTPPAGLYMWVGTGAGVWYIEIFQAANWRATFTAVCGGFLLTDGANARVKNGDAAPHTLYFRALA